MKPYQFERIDNTLDPAPVLAAHQFSFAEVSNELNRLRGEALRWRQVAYMVAAQYVPAPINARQMADRMFDELGEDHSL